MKGVTADLAELRFRIVQIEQINRLEAEIPPRATNLIFQERAALNRLFQRLIDLNRTIGTPEKLGIFFARPQFRADTRTAETTVKITRFRTPVLRTGFKNTLLKQYVKEGSLLRTETSTFRAVSRGRSGAD